LNLVFQDLKILMKNLYFYFLIILLKDQEKLLDFQDFCIVANLMNNKTHLTSDGLNQIRLIKQGMNSYRI